MPWVGATLCTFPAFSLGSTNAMVESPHGGPHLFPFVAVFLGAFRPLHPTTHKRKKKCRINTCTCCVVSHRLVRTYPVIISFASPSQPPSALIPCLRRGIRHFACSPPGPQRLDAPGVFQFPTLYLLDGGAPSADFTFLPLRNPFCLDPSERRSPLVFLFFTFPRVLNAPGTTIYPARHFWLSLVFLPRSPIVAELPVLTPPAAPHPGASLHPTRHFWLSLMFLPRSPIVAELPVLTPPTTPRPGAGLPPLTRCASRAPCFHPWPPPGQPILPHALPAPTIS